MKYEDDITISGLDINNNEGSYLAELCTENNILLNISKTKQLDVDCCFRFLGVTITDGHHMSPPWLMKHIKRLYSMET